MFECWFNKMGWCVVVIKLLDLGKYCIGIYIVKIKFDGEDVIDWLGNCFVWY